jgi:hypothetical protein
MATEHYKILPWWNIKRLYNRHIRPLIPALVWRGQEVDVNINFPMPNEENKLDIRNLFDAERSLYEYGLNFDTGAGLMKGPEARRDWEWDFSLRGNVSVKFRGVCKTKEKRNIV